MLFIGTFSASALISALLSSKVFHTLANMSQAAIIPSKKSRVLAVIAAFGVVGLCFGGLPLLFKLYRLLFDEKSIMGTFVLEIFLLCLVLVLSILLKKCWPTLYDPNLVIVPKLTLRSVRLFLWGCFLGALTCGIILTIVYALGGIHLTWKSMGAPQAAWILFIFFGINLLGAAFEEYATRGWPFSLCTQVIGPHLTVILLGLAFACAHLVHPIWSVRSIAAVWLAGIFLGYVMLWSRNILVPIGLHTGFNFVQYESTTTRLWHVERSPNLWVSGGDWGIEASAAGMGVVALGAIVALIGYVRSSRRNHAQSK